MLSWSLVAYGLILVILTIPCQKIESVVTDDAVLLYNKAVAIHNDVFKETAISFYRSALEISWDFPHAHQNLAILLDQIGDFNGARLHHQHSISFAPSEDFKLRALSNLIGLETRLEPNNKVWLDNHISTLIQMSETLVNNTDLLFSLASLYRRIGKTGLALENFMKIVAIEPNHSLATMNIGNYHFYRNDFINATNYYEKALSNMASSDSSTRAMVQTNLGQTYRERGLFKQALSSFKLAYNLTSPYQTKLKLSKLTDIFTIKSLGTLWQDYEETEDVLLKSAMDLFAIPNVKFAGEGEAPLDPYSYSLLRYSTPRLDQWINNYGCPEVGKFLVNESALLARLRSKYQQTNSGKAYLNIGYLSFDWRNHPMGRLTADITTPAIADQQRWSLSVNCFMYGYADVSVERTFVQSHCPYFHDVYNLRHDHDVAEYLVQQGIDVVIDITGHTYNNRIGISSLKPAPVMINYLGYPSTTGCAAFDYSMVDHWVSPPDYVAARKVFTESLIYLPFSYQANMMPTAPLFLNESTLLATESTGASHNPLHICVFNAHKKFEPTSWHTWMNLLHEVPRGHLYLLDVPVEEQRQFRIHAAYFGIPVARIHFMPRMNWRRHLVRARMQCDVSLDTFVYGAHTTATDLLWVGVPILVLRGYGAGQGARMPSRVAASTIVNLLAHRHRTQQTLSASLESSEDIVDLLVHDTIKGYEVAFRRLSSSVTHLPRIRKALQEARCTSPLFDTRIHFHSTMAAYRAAYEVKYLQSTVAATSSTADKSQVRSPWHIVLLKDYYETAFERGDHQDESFNGTGHSEGDRAPTGNHSNHRMNVCEAAFDVQNHAVDEKDESAVVAREKSLIWHGDLLPFRDQIRTQSTHATTYTDQMMEENQRDQTCEQQWMTFVTKAIDESTAEENSFHLRYTVLHDLFECLPHSEASGEHPPSLNWLHNGLTRLVAAPIGPRRVRVVALLVEYLVEMLHLECNSHLPELLHVLGLNLTRNASTGTNEPAVMCREETLPHIYAANELLLSLGNQISHVHSRVLQLSLLWHLLPCWQDKIFPVSSSTNKKPRFSVRRISPFRSLPVVSIRVLSYSAVKVFADWLSEVATHTLSQPPEGYQTTSDACDSIHSDGFFLFVASHLLTTTTFTDDDTLDSSTTAQERQQRMNHHPRGLLNGASLASQCTHATSHPLWSFLVGHLAVHLPYAELNPFHRTNQQASVATPSWLLPTRPPLDPALEDALAGKTRGTVAIYCHEYGQEWWPGWGPFSFPDIYPLPAATMSPSSHSSDRNESSARGKAAGGAEEAVAYLALALAQEQGYQVHIFVDALTEAEDGYTVVFPTSGGYVRWLQRLHFDRNMEPAFDVFIAWRYAFNLALCPQAWSVGSRFTGSSRGNYGTGKHAAGTNKITTEELTKVDTDDRSQPKRTCQCHLWLHDLVPHTALVPLSLAQVLVHGIWTQSAFHQHFVAEEYGKAQQSVRHVPSLLRMMKQMVPSADYRYIGDEQASADDSSTMKDSTETDPLLGIHVLPNALPDLAFPPESLSSITKDDQSLTPAPNTPIIKNNRVFLYASAPNRGLEDVLRIWPFIYRNLSSSDSASPELHIYYGFPLQVQTRLRQSMGSATFETWYHYLLRLLHETPGVHYHGAVDQSTLARAYAMASFWLYPSSFPETGCISMLRAMAAGAIPITSRLQESVLATLGNRHLPCHEMLDVDDAFDCTLLPIPGYDLGPVEQPLTRRIAQHTVDHRDWLFLHYLPAVLHAAGLSEQMLMGLRQQMQREMWRRRRWRHSAEMTEEFFLSTAHGMNPAVVH